MSLRAASRPRTAGATRGLQAPMPKPRGVLPGSGRWALSCRCRRLRCRAPGCLRRGGSHAWRRGGCSPARCAVKRRAAFCMTDRPAAGGASTFIPRFCLSVSSHLRYTKAYAMLCYAMLYAILCKARPGREPRAQQSKGTPPRSVHWRRPCMFVRARPPVPVCLC